MTAIKNKSDFLFAVAKLVWLVALSYCSVMITYWDNNRTTYLNVQSPNKPQCPISNPMTLRYVVIVLDFVFILDRGL